ncbi:hypothetical protein H1R17_11920 [Flavobacterium sp. xlx-214]|uniref:hypothetical protein n=1 Tax=unclassified Flavobacterium TaxID=196869 RepID=UPI0013D08A9E|nr:MULTISPECIES: hypothetical protein [unclassified Flavobacterium]MBA5794028.1 hypothetical protein [Flavobacterium sp. xlx-221]QMI83157.1 hypothetical protein H1R17_11920 [Flavobacterium sp. xlx-214]
MKKQVLALGALLSLTQVNAQESSVLDIVSLEASYGMAVPLSPTENIKAADYLSFINFQGAINYKIDDIWGLRASYAYQSFTNKNSSKLGVEYHKFMIEATYNILTAINQSDSYTQQKPFEIVAHAGIGGAFAYREIVKQANKMGNIQIGLKPMYTLASRINIFLDGTYVINFNQAYDVASNNIYGGTTGSYLTANIGLQLKLGE